MPELLLADIPIRLIDELREWAALRRCSVQGAAIEMIRIGLYETRRPNVPERPEDVRPKGTLD